MTSQQQYRGRIAPSPTGYLHLGHARTFWSAQLRARQHGGILVFRNEDLDGARCKPEFVNAMADDLRWFGVDWQEGPDRGGAFGPYVQSQRIPIYRQAFCVLREKGLVYPCSCSRQDVLRALSAPHTGDEEPVYPGTCRPKERPCVPSTPLLVRGQPVPANPTGTSRPRSSIKWEGECPGESCGRVNWRFRVPDGDAISFVDGNFGPQSLVAGRDFGDFVVWRHDDIPSYQLAVVADDIAMRITEVVRGADLLVSTARQILLYRALGVNPPDFHHCALMTDEKGVRLAKRHDALSLRSLRGQGITPETLRQDW